MMTVNSRLMQSAFLALAENSDQGIHVVDSDGVTVLYNKAMEEIEGMSARDVVGKHIRDAYGRHHEENSTMLAVIKTGKPVYKANQEYLNRSGKTVFSVNTTVPLTDRGEVLGALEIAGNVTEVSHLSEEIIKLRQQLIKPKKKPHVEKHYSFDMLIGKDAKYLEAVKLAIRAARSSSNVLIYGETGTGKELFAQSIHYESARADKPFIAVNCAALPESLLEGTLFGTTKGSFTSAVDRPGIFEQADGGTLLLDEFNSMSLNLQSKLLRVLQENYIRRVGGLKDIKVDVRIIAATNEKPAILLERGELRRDLYYRINVMSISIPSLRERRGDIALLIEYFLERINAKLSKSVNRIDEAILSCLYQYDWKGNVRELQNFLESTLNMMNDEQIIRREHLPGHWRDIVIDCDELEKSRSDQAPAEGEQQYGALTNLNRALARIEDDIIEQRLAHYCGNITKAAQ
ncbi:MAG: sigma-54-dependent Fis family transcriptional regulator [Clostridiales bacterium]|nr:MAG: sigma-54-dependent Fis family transcriptional regulator [Clostridiales bacterium]